MLHSPVGRSIDCRCGLVAILFAVPLLADPSITTVRVSPTTVAIGTPTTITVQASITDPTFIAGSADLLQLNADGSTTVLGALHDDGKNGDLFAGDLVFALALTINQPAVAQLQLQVSAAFTGQLMRVKSSTLNVFVQPADAPQQALLGLAANLASGNQTAALNYVNPFSPGAAALGTYNQQALTFLAGQLSSAVLVESSMDHRVFHSTFTTASGAVVTLEFDMVPNDNGQWVLDSW